MSVLYTAKASVQGEGRKGRGSTDDGRLDVELSVPKGMGGDDGPGTNPEQLFAVGYAACFHGALKNVARQNKVDAADSTVSAAVSLGKGDDGFGLSVELTVTIPGQDQPSAQKLVDAAHQMCPYSKATRGNIDVTVTALAGCPRPLPAGCGAPASGRPSTGTTRRNPVHDTPSAEHPGPPALLITGTVGAGKTTTADAAGALLAEAGTPHAVIDLDELCRFWPAPAGDRFNFGLLMRNLRCVAAGHREAGARMLILAGVVETPEELRRCREAVGTGLAVCRLRTGPAELRRRLARRHRGDPDGLRWHLDRHAELDAVLDRAGIAGTEVETDGLTAAEAAAAVLAAVGRR